MRAHGPSFLPRLLTLAIAAAFSTLFACDGLEDFDVGLDCEEACLLEEECGLRTFEACQAASCFGDVRVPSASDTCMQFATDCAEMALCTCPETCSKLEECTESPDESCAGNCEFLVEQDPISTYQENRCVIESGCESLATCGGVSG